MEQHKGNKLFFFISGLLIIAFLSACGFMTTALPAAISELTGGSVTRVSNPEQVETSQAVQEPAAVTEEDPVEVITGSTAIYQPSTELEARLIEVYQATNPSVVYILTPTGSGSGFVYSEDGMIVTNNHVVEGSDRFEVIFSNGDHQEARLVGSDVDGDLAVIQVDALPEGVAPLPVADSDAISVGQFVVAIGNPFGEQGSMSFGIVSGLGRSLSSQRELEQGSTYSLPKVIQTDTPINPGNSGGPLMNLNGEVIGVNAAIASVTGTNSGVGFAIPSNAVMRIVPSLIEKGEYDYPYMGAGFVSELTLDAINELNLSQTQGAYVISITPGSPADEAGLIPADEVSGLGGDLVIAIDGQPVSDFDDLNSYLVFDTEAGQTIELTVLRDGEEITLPLTLGDRP